VERRGDALVLRAVDSESVSGREPAAVGTPDSSGGSLTHLPPAPPPLSTEGSSTTANGTWHGSQIYTLVGGSGSWMQYAGTRVAVTGSIEPLDPQRPAGTDQMQSAHGAVFAPLRPATIVAVDGACPQARFNQTVESETAKSIPADPAVH